MSEFIEDFPPQPLLEQLWILSPGDDTGMVQFFDRLPGTICASVVIDVNIIRPFDSFRKANLNYVGFVLA
jgi:hypothetical protein